MTIQALFNETHAQLFHHVSFDYYRSPGVDCVIHLIPGFKQEVVGGRGNDETEALMDAVAKARQKKEEEATHG